MYYQEDTGAAAVEWLVSGEASAGLGGKGWAGVSHWRYKPAVQVVILFIDIARRMSVSREAELPNQPELGGSV